MRDAWNIPHRINNNIRLLLLLVIVVPFQFYAIGPAFLPLLEADLLGLYVGQSVILEFQGHLLAMTPVNQSWFHNCWEVFGRLALSDVAIPPCSNAC